MVELEADAEQQVALKDARGHAGVADRAEQDRVVAAQLPQRLVGQRLTGPVVAGRAQVVVGGFDLQADRVEDLQTLGHDLGTDPVSRDHC